MTCNLDKRTWLSTDGVQDYINILWGGIVYTGRVGETWCVFAEAIPDGVARRVHEYFGIRRGMSPEPDYTLA